SPRSTSSCAERGRCSARASPACRSSASRGCPTTRSCSSAPGAAPTSWRAPTGSATRPTADRVREALFSILGDVSQLRVLDLYAGSGALGIEALSRGAREATAVDHARPATEAIARNLDSLGAEAEVVLSD